MPSVPDLTPDEIAAVLAARRRNAPVEDDLPPSLTARLDREVAARVDAELAARAEGGHIAGPATVQIVKQRGQSNNGLVMGIVSLVTGIPLMGIVEGTSHGNLLGAGIVTAGIVLVNVAHTVGRNRRR